MRVLMALLWFVIFALPGLNVARAESYQMLSYAELMALPSEQRVQYIQGVREILIDLSKNSNGRFSDSDIANRSRLRAWLEFIDREVQTAHAESRKSALCAKNPDCAKAQVDCFSQRKLGVKWSDGTYQCDEAKPIITKTSRNIFNFRLSAEDRTLRDLNKKAVDPRYGNDVKGAIEVDSSEPADKGGGQTIIQKTAGAFTSARTVQEYANAIAQGSNKYKCVSKYQNVSTPQTVGLEPCNPTTEKLIESDFEDQKPPEFRPLPAATETVQPLPAPAPVTVESTATSVHALEVKAEKIDEVPVAAAAPSVAPAALPEEPSEEDKAKAIIIKPAQSSKSKQTKPTRVKTAEAPDISKYTCAPKPEKCDDPKSARSKVFQGNLACVFAGMVSQFDSGNRKCAAVTEFKLGDSSYKCSSGQTMCNPLLFGTVSSSKPICVGRGRDVTVQCSKLSNSRDAELFLNRNEPGLQNRWDEFRESLANVCKPGSIQAKFHCVECGVMNRRLFELHARLVGDPCKAGAATFDSAIKTRIKTRGSSTTK